MSLVLQKSLPLKLNDTSTSYIIRKNTKCLLEAWTFILKEYFTKYFSTNYFFLIDGNVYFEVCSNFMSLVR